MKISWPRGAARILLDEESYSHGVAGQGQTAFEMMQNISQRYTHWANERYDRVGHLFQGRYKAILVDKDAYLLELIRYIHLNPVRANIVTDPIDYPSSSHAAYAGHVQPPS